MAGASFFSVSDIFRDRRKLKIFLVCVAVSVLMWLLISLSKQYNQTIFIPVRYINYPQQKTLVNAVPNRLAVNISGTGFELLKLDRSLVDDTLTINLDNLKMNMRGGYERGFLDPAFLSSSLEQRISGALSINQVLSDSIEFIFDLRVTRRLAVKPEIKIELEQGFVLLDSISCIPADVEVTGPLSMLDTLSRITTKSISTDPLRESITYITSINLGSLGRSSTAEPDSVKVIVNVDRLTEKKFAIEPVIINAPDSITLMLFPNTVEITALVPLTLFDEISITDFRVVVDFKAYQKGMLALPVVVENWPVAARKVTTRPEKVEIAIKKR